MLRRALLQNLAALSSLKAAASTPKTPTQTIQLAAEPIEIHDVQGTPTESAFLVFHKSTNSWQIHRTNPDSIIPLPAGQYTTLGLTPTGLYVRARRSTGQPVNSILRITPGAAPEFIGHLPLSAAYEPVFFHRTQVLQSDPYSLHVSGLSPAGIGRARDYTANIPHCSYDILPTQALFTAFDGSSLTTFDLDTRTVSTAPIALPGPKPEPSTSSYVMSVVVPATGTDAEGNLYAIVLPSPRAAVRCVKIAPDGAASLWATLEVPPSAKGFKKLLFQNGNSFAVVFANGSIASYDL
ncbi:MAG: hypothetical protein HY821_06760 [Acidobacteria bacterium]|nr:hypothetical protein [Acidobacteriota bacterium]